MIRVRTRRRPARSAETGTAARSTAHYTVKATQAKNRFGAILRAVRNDQPVFIEKHGSPQAVVLGIASYEALVLKARAPHDLQLDALREEFEALYMRMQTAKARKVARLVSSVSADELNDVAAVRAKARG